MRYLGLREQLLAEKRKNEALQALCKDLTDAVVELAAIVVEEEEPNGEDIPAEDPS